MKKTQTIDLKGKAYAQVKDRLKEFRSDNPRGLVETTPTITEDYVMFKARIVKDKADDTSAEATGHSMGKGTGEKNFEKQETIAVGRALALLGYASDGEIASSEEMMEFEEYKQERIAEVVMETTESIGNCATLEELQKLWTNTPGDVKKLVESAKDAKKEELTNNNENS